MSSQGRTTWNKRQKEQARQQKARDKAQRKADRKTEKPDSGSSSLDALIAFDEPNPLAPPPPTPESGE